MHDDVIRPYPICELEAPLYLVDGFLATSTFGVEGRNPPSFASFALEKWQMDRRCRQGILFEPSPDRPEKMPIVKVEVRPIAEQLDSAVSRFAQRFQQIQMYLLLTIELGRNAEIHQASITFAVLARHERA